MKASDFAIGQRVLYIPNHANGDATHEDCERGEVVNIGGDTVFVRFEGSMKNWPQGCYPHNLILRP